MLSRKTDATPKYTFVNVQNLRDNVLGSPSFNNADERKAAMEKAKWCDEMLTAIKEKIEMCDKRAITQLLTLVPWSVALKNIMLTFNVTKYQVIKAKNYSTKKVSWLCHYCRK